MWLQSCCCAACAVHAVCAVANTSDCCCAFMGKSATGWHNLLPVLFASYTALVTARLHKLHGVVASCHCFLPAGHASMQLFSLAATTGCIAASPPGVLSR